MHGLRAQVLADRAAEYGPPVTHARVGRAARSFELYLLRPVGGAQLTQQNGPAVAELASPLPELMTAVHASQRFGARQNLIACQSLQGLL